MKYLFLFAVLMFNVNCSSSKHDNPEVSEIIYETSTRGSSTTYQFTPDFVNIKATGVNDSKATRGLNPEEWKMLLAQVDKINLDQLNDLKSPSDERASDAALHAKLTIRKNNRNYETNLFDHGNPPSEIKGLTEAILRLSENVE